MNIGNAKLAFGLSVKLFSDILKGLHSKNVIPQQIEIEHEVKLVDQLKATLFLNLEIDSPHFNADMSDPQLPLILEIKGRVTPKIGFAGEISPDLFTVGFAGAARFNVVLKSRTGQAPVIKLEYGGADYASEPFEKKFIDDIFETQVLKDVFEKLELDVLEPLLEGLGNIFYFDKPDNDKPGHDQYPISLQKMRGGPDSRNAIVMFSERRELY